MHAVEAIYRKARNVSLQLASDEVFSFVQSRGKGEEVKDNAAIEVRKSNSSPDPRHPAPHFAAAPPRQQSALTDQPVAEDAEEELEEGRLEFDYEKLAAEAPTGPLFEFPEDEIELKRLSRQQEFPLHPHLRDTGQEAAVDAGEAAYIADLVQFFTEDWWFLQRKHDPSPPLPVPPPPDPDSLRDEYEGARQPRATFFFVLRSSSRCTSPLTRRRRSARGRPSQPNWPLQCPCGQRGRPG